MDGETLAFHRAKSKELLAYLIDRNGKDITRAGIFSVLWEDAVYDRSKQKYLDVVIRSLRDAGIEDILEIKDGYLRIRPEMLDCDLYRFLRNDPAAVNSYRGEYMEEYAWAVFNAESLALRG